MSGIAFKGKGNMSISRRSKKNLLIIVVIVFAVLLALLFRVGWIQIVKGEEYSARAIQQQTKDQTLKAERGVIYDANGEELAVSVTCYSIWVRPDNVKTGETGAEIGANMAATAAVLAENTDVPKTKINRILNSEQKLVCVTRGLNKEAADRIRESKAKGIEIVEDTKRNYPLGESAAHVIGSVNIDNQGLSGLELEYNTFLSGISGRWISYTDTGGRQLTTTYDEERYYKAKDGYNLVTTLDHVVQHYLEEALDDAVKRCKAKRALGIVMNVETGDVMGMAQSPAFDLNEPMLPPGDDAREKFKELSDAEQSEYLSDMWRNSLICDVYEPGSTFKLITTSTALEENITNMKKKYECNSGYKVGGRFIQCWAYPDSHGTETLKEAVSNSCNPVFMKIALKIGIDTFYDYLDVFGITQPTGIDFPGETQAILQDRASAGEVGLATIGFGQGVAVTPIQLITAVCSLGNDGKLMKPRLVKAMTDSDGNVVKEFEPEFVRRTVSKKTARTVCDIMEFVADGGGAAAAAVEGYRVGAKTGTANKLRDDGVGYSDNTYSSCIAMAPMNDPKIAVLIIVDSPKGVRYGSVTAAPAVNKVLTKALPYLNISTDAKKKEDDDETVKVPDLIGKNASDASGILESKELRYDLDDSADYGEDYVVIKQYPVAGTKVVKGTKVYLYRQ